MDLEPRLAWTMKFRSPRTRSPQFHYIGKIEVLKGLRLQHKCTVVGMAGLRV
jgi:hypothetical protein